MGSPVPAHTLSTHILACVSMYSSTSFLLLFLPLEGISAGSVCSDCVSFGSVWPPPCFETGRSLTENDLKSVKSSTAEKCQELCQEEKECRVWSLGEGECHLKTALEGTQSSYPDTGDWVSGPKYCVGQYRSQIPRV